MAIFNKDLVAHYRFSELLETTASWPKTERAVWRKLPVAGSFVLIRQQARFVNYDARLDMIVTVTGLQVKSPWHWPVFWYHALPAAAQCRAAEGCVTLHTFSDGGFMHTFSVFDTRRNLKAFSMTGAHRRASKAFSRIAIGKVLTWDCEDIPSIKDALSVWREQARWY